jgi:hypothetical protein
VRRGLAITLAAGLVALAAPVAVASAADDRLTVGKAKAVTSLVADRDCRDDNDCDSFGSADCERHSSRRVSCLAVTFHADGSTCERRVVVRLKGDGKTLKYTKGDRDCA